MLGLPTYSTLKITSKCIGVAATDVCAMEAMLDEISDDIAATNKVD